MSQYTKMCSKKHYFALPWSNAIEKILITFMHGREWTKIKYNGTFDGTSVIKARYMFRSSSLRLLFLSSPFGTCSQKSRSPYSFVHSTTNYLTIYSTERQNEKERLVRDNRDHLGKTEKECFLYISILRII